MEQECRPSSVGLQYSLAFLNTEGCLLKMQSPRSFLHLLNGNLWGWSLGICIFRKHFRLVLYTRKYGNLETYVLRLALRGLRKVWSITPHHLPKSLPSCGQIKMDTWWLFPLPPLSFFTPAQNHWPSMTKEQLHHWTQGKHYQYLL